ncbi:hypothetical protein M433DRAFT_160613 [Acidomyces richmondensis BFW]|nr:MAG: hypothetical protein FE78DRAFT_88012 [Acidomyces sp. 'richmondensis']KYG40306.1 hypothetical protein M433DRAFT_160613 [Acidomyces richmondensis BFW]
MPFGLKKGEKDGDLSSKKAALFGKTKASKSAAPSSSNPYAAAPPASSDPYGQRNGNPYATQNGASDPYMNHSQSSLSPPTTSFSSLTLQSEEGGPPSYGVDSGTTPNRYEKSPVPPGGYGGGGPRYQPGGSYGQTSGYGNDPYGGGSNPYGSGQSRYGPGGYGGLGRTNSQDTTTTDAGRAALFGDAAKRAQEQRTAAETQNGGDNSYANSSGYDSSDLPGGYGANRELTAEEQEEQEVSATKQQIRETKQDTLSALDRSNAIVARMLETGSSTMNTLGRQSDMIHNTEMHLDKAREHALLADGKTDELRRLNRSMFIPAYGNPFTRSKRELAEIEKEQLRRLDQRQLEEKSRKAAYDSLARRQGHEQDMNGNMVRQSGQTQKSLADRAKYQFEADSEDDEMENRIDDGIDMLGHGVRHIKGLAKAMGTELEAQNKHIERISGKTDDVDWEVTRQSKKLEIISRKG